MDSSTVAESLDIIGVVIRKSKPRSLIVSIYLFFREAGSDPNSSIGNISNRSGLLGKLHSVFVVVSRDFVRLTFRTILSH